MKSTLFSRWQRTFISPPDSSRFVLFLLPIFHFPPQYGKAACAVFNHISKTATFAFSCVHPFSGFHLNGRRHFCRWRSHNCECCCCRRSNTTATGMTSQVSTFTPSLFASYCIQWTQSDFVDDVRYYRSFGPVAPFSRFACLCKHDRISASAEIARRSESLFCSIKGENGFCWFYLAFLWAITTFTKACQSQ